MPALLPLYALLFAQAASAAATSPAEDEERLQFCLDRAGNAPTTALLYAADWLPEADLTERSQVQHCLGVAYTNLMRWEEAEAAFLRARDTRAPDEPDWRARFGAMAANAALASGRNEEALAHLRFAQADAAEAGEGPLGGTIAADRARALVALGRLDEAVQALGDARNLAPEDAQGWLLSATLARRQEDLGQAQLWIAEASRLAPDDPAIALETGVIFALGRDDEAARAAWEGLLARSPATPEAGTARDYLNQLAGDAGR